MSNENNVSLMMAPSGSAAPGADNSEKGELLLGVGAHAVEQQVMTFSEDGDVMTENRTQPSSDRRKFLNDADDDLVNDIVGFLERPIQVANFDWLATSPDLSALATIDLPGQWLSQAMIKEKVAGFRFLRCDFVVRVQVNAQPFNAGRLILVYLPLQGQVYEMSNMGILSGLTGYRHVDLDLSTSTAVELRIPFHGPISHFDLIQANGTLGRVLLNVYSPLTGMADVDGTMWCWAENVNITMPTGMPNMITNVNYGYAQAGGDEKGKSKKLANEKKRPGDVEKLATQVGDVSRTLEKVPLIGEFAGVATWVADAVAAVASIFGFSKPTDPTFPLPIEPHYGRYFANYNGVSVEKSLALDSRNAVDMPLEVYGTNEDEMSIMGIVSKPVFMDFFTFDKTQAQGSLLWKWPACPEACKRVVVNNPGTPPPTDGIVSYNTYLSYLSNGFRFWRGTICYKLRVVKTPFHSGRIRVTIVPGAQWLTNFASIDINKNYSTIYDLRETNEIDICVPYAWKAPWKSIPAPIDGINPSRPAYAEAPSMIYVSVVNSLRNPTTTADQIEILVEEYAGSDFEFAYPGIWSTMRIVPNEAVLPALSVGSGKYDDYAYGVAQSGDIPMKPQDEFTPNALAMGEAVRSCRQILKRFSFWTSGIVNNTSPFQLLTELAVTPTTLFDIYTEPRTPDMLTFFSWLYRFKSGSMRVATLNSGTEKGYATIIPRSTDMTLLQDTVTGPTQVQFPDIERYVEFNVPFYQQWPAIPTSCGEPEVNACESALSGPFHDFKVVPYNEGTVFRYDTMETDPSVAQHWRAVGDDFSLGYLIGPPATVVFRS